MSNSDYLGQSTDLILGQEFLTWLWFKTDTNNVFDAPASKGFDGGAFIINVGQRLVVEGGEGEARETASVSGAASPLKEARLGLATGKKVTKALISIERIEEAWQLTLKANDFSINSLKTPTIDKSDKDDDADAIFLEKIYLIETCTNALDYIYKEFLQLRLSEQWTEENLKIRNWIKARPDA
ncbi:hypothetical protein [Desulfovibrio litoralis]|uniref:Uncharacterized protein n=1 Tax=Desulfovibrio litoralis DSM 11393 TaxID=1121455 RepID=A0A1M7RXV4_9BACT|nr:hypothetical protein [Desulfovibrio litoralis]SHN50892.1 hypothetical protein SAMN02745728_00297 [Desulfovibrio litoralis DSM 11393]